MNTPEQSAREFIGADALAGIGYEKWLEVATKAIAYDRAQNIAAPVVVGSDDMGMLMTEHFASTQQGDLEVDLYRTGVLIEAVVSRAGERVLREILNIRPSLDSWLKTLLDRAQKGEAHG